MKTIDLAFSPCPNDTFIFHAMLHSLVDTDGYRFSPYLDDVETLNNKAFAHTFPVSKMSFHAYLYLKKYYTLLDAGSALGFSCGPLLIARDKNVDLANCTIAIPGMYTTAHMLLRLWQPTISNIIVTRFDSIIEGVQKGLFDAGLIIHEGRFIYQDYGLERIIDLGEWWELATTLPIPLGCIAIRNDFLQHKTRINSILRASIEYALQHKEVSRSYIKSHSQELDDSVIDKHIQLYVNEYSIDLGDIGKQAITKLEEMATCKGIISLEL